MSPPTPHTGLPMRRRRRWSTPQLLAAVVLAASAAFLCGVPLGFAGGRATPAVTITRADPSTRSVPTTAAGHLVRFEVTASGGIASLVKWHADDDEAEFTAVRTPWAYEYRSTWPYTFAWLRGFAATGTVSCRLLVDGKVVDEGESQRQVTCAGSTVG